MENWKRIFNDPPAKDLYRKYVEAWEKKIHSFLQFDLSLAGESSSADNGKGKFRGVPFAVKDNIAVRSFQLSCASKILQPFTSPYSATAVEKLQKEGALAVGKTNLDEFGMGSSTENSAMGSTNNPWDPSRVAGGSSGGSAAAVAAGLVPFALGTDTGGSIRQPASFCGVYGLKPTYGVVSRYGLVAYASSLEVVGILSVHPAYLEDVFEVIKGSDPMDNSSVPHEPEGAEKDADIIGVLPESQLDLEKPVMEGYKKTIHRLQKIGYQIKEIRIPALEYTVPAYYTIATAEASANLARFTGIRYGHRADDSETYEQLLIRSRSEGFGDEVKLRILLGTYVLRSGFQDQYYIRAQKIRTAIRQGFQAAFADVDLLMMPVYPTVAFPHGKGGLTPFQQKIADYYTSSANLAGIPALAFPADVQEGLPVGMQFIAPHFEERRLFQAARRWNREFPVQVCPGFSEDWSV